MSGRLLRHLRRRVVATGEWPGLSRIYRRVYAVQTERATAALAAIPGLRSLYLRGSAQRRIRAGLTDIDFVAVLEEDLAAADELAAITAIHRAVDRVNRGAPLVRDVHIVTAPELRFASELAAPLPAFLRQDATCVAGVDEQPAPSPSPHLGLEALRRETLFWTTRAGEQMVHEPEPIRRRLAARSLAKAEIFRDAVSRGELDLDAALIRCRTAPWPTDIDWPDLTAAMVRADAVLDEAPPLDGARGDDLSPSWRALAGRLRGWAAGLAAGPAVSDVLLSVEGPCLYDLRLFVLLDPHHPDAARALEELARHSRAGILEPPHYSRAPCPLVVTAAQLRRPGYLRSTAMEPFVRRRFGTSLMRGEGRELESPQGRAGEMAGGVALSVVQAAIRARELCGGAPSLRQAAKWSDLFDGLFPAARALLAGDDPRQAVHRCEPAPSLSPTVERLADPAGRVELFARLRAATRELSPLLVELSRARAAASVGASAAGEMESPAAV